MKRLATIALSAAGLLVAASAFAASGDLVKTDYSTTFQLDNSASRLAFPDDTTVQSWGSPAAAIVDTSTISQWPMRGVMPIREGYSLVKFGTDPQIYAVSPGGVLHHIATADIAVALYGPKWESRIVDLFYSYWPNYKIGSDITDATYPDGTLFKYAGKKTIYYLTNGVQRPFASTAAFKANRFSADAVVTVSVSVKFVPGNPITGFERALNATLVE